MLLSELQVNEPTLYQEITMDHKIFSLHFGSIDDKEELEEEFGEESISSIERGLAIPVLSASHNKKQKRKRDYFLKVIPHMYYDANMISSEKLKSELYQYSAQFRCDVIHALLTILIRMLTNNQLLL